jgi:hypothetical protein
MLCGWEGRGQCKFYSSQEVAKIIKIGLTDVERGRVHKGDDSESVDA